MAGHKSQDSEIKELHRYIRDLEKIIETLSLDPSYGIVTRPAIDLELRPFASRARFVIFLDIDYLHYLNSTLPGGHEEANKKIRRALNVRAEDVLLRARWYSGDEIIIITSGDPSIVCSRLLESFKREGMSFTYAFTPYTGKLEDDAARAKVVVDDLKKSRGLER